MIEIGLSFITTEAKSVEEFIEKMKLQIEQKPQIPQLTIVFASSQLASQYEALINGLKQNIGGEIIGASSAGEISPSGFQTGSIVGLSIIAPQTIFKASTAQDQKVADAFVKAFEKLNVSLDLFSLYFSEKNTLQAVRNLPFYSLILLSGLKGDEEEKLAEIAEVSLNKVSTAGASAGSEEITEQTYVFSMDGVVEDGVSVAGIYSLLKMGIGIKHGFRMRKDKFGVVTENGDSLRIVKKINGEKAVDVYCRWLGVNKLDNEIFALNPVGSIEPSSGIIKVRSPGKVLEDGSILFYSNVPVGTGLVLLESTPQLHVNALKKAIEEAYYRAGSPKEIGAILIFNCVLRTVLSQKWQTIEEEIKIVQEFAGKEVSFIGFSTFGETGNSNLMPLWHHNQTVTVLLIGKELIKG